eukprot:Nk52_evm7s7 gene=Nk52_evmTU7s7
MGSTCNSNVKRKDLFFISSCVNFVLMLTLIAITVLSLNVVPAQAMDANKRFPVTQKFNSCFCRKKTNNCQYLINHTVNGETNSKLYSCKLSEQGQDFIINACEVIKQYPMGKHAEILTKKEHIMWHCPYGEAFDAFGVGKQVEARGMKCQRSDEKASKKVENAARKFITCLLEGEGIKSVRDE